MARPGDVLLTLFTVGRQKDDSNPPDLNKICFLELKKPRILSS